MKKIIFLFSLFIIILNLDAQKLSKSGSNIKAGLRIGVVGSQISGDDLSGYHKVGAYAGIFANMPISASGKWHFQMEINFIMKGSSTQIRANEDGTLPDYYVLTLLYTETPFMFQYNFGTFKKANGSIIDFDLEFGPTINFLFYQKEEFNGIDIHRYPEDLFHFWDVGIIAGLKCKFSEKSSISFRYGTSVYPVRFPDFVYNRAIKLQFNDHIALTYCYHF